MITSKAETRRKPHLCLHGDCAICTKPLIAGKRLSENVNVMSSVKSK